MNKSVTFGLAAVVLAGVGFGAWTLSDPKPAHAAEMVVYKSPTCGCCGAWVDHVRANGFEVEVKEVFDLDPIKASAGVPGEMESCHTAMIDGYVVEGHVPAEDIKRLISEKPDVKGIAVPGMPIGSPGMEQGDYKEPYASVLFGKQGYKIFAQH
ncbi:DUF411 domain-containing protein [Magnetovibrio sp. PR-2]|uniref:DUF411 domain-containing protein n=1 Tax=Magnetovibrio sp. PR-2 TaxID=3120356 RepID=UPI002FCE57D6